MGLIANPNALAKCKKFVRDEMPRQLNVVMAESMDDSARLLSNYNLTYSIIGTEKTAELYNLNILKEHIEDDKDNNRRFIVIGDAETIPTGNDKTSTYHLFTKNLHLYKYTENFRDYVDLSLIADDYLYYEVCMKALLFLNEDLDRVSTFKTLRDEAFLDVQNHVQHLHDRGTISIKG